MVYKNKEPMVNCCFMGRVFAFLLVVPFVTLAQSTTATLSVRVADTSDASIGGAILVLDNAVSGFHREAATDEDGLATLMNVPLGEYRLAVSKPGFAADQRSVSLRTNIRVSIPVTLRVAAVEERVSVTAFETADLIDTEMTGTRTVMNQDAIEKMPVAVGSRGVEALIVSFPGFAANANGAIHPRGAHNQMTFVVDGMPISDQLTGAFATSIDSNFVQTLELYTGNVPAEFGSKISGVANVITRSGAGSGRKFGGSLLTGVSQFDSANSVAQVHGESGRLGYLATVSAAKSNRFLDQVAIENLHNGGNTERGMVRIDYQLTQRDALRWHAMGGRSAFQLSNLPSQHANLQDQRQHFRDFSTWAGWVHTISPRATYDVTASYRTAIAQLLPSPGDTPVTASQARHLSTVNQSHRVNYLWGRHSLRAGFDWQHFPVSEHFTFGITDPNFNDPRSDGYLKTLLPFDLTRGGGLFEFAGKGKGNLYTGFLQDNLKLGALSLSLGLRYDNYRFLVNGNQLQPRLGFAYHIAKTGTVLRGSYNRTYQTPPNENLLLANSEAATRLVLDEVRDQVGGGFLLIRPERQNVFEAGVQQALFKRFSLNVMYYHKNSTDLQDNDNFLNTGVIFPTSLARSRVNGFETRLTVPEFRGFTGAISATHYRVIATPPFTGGLFLGNAAVELLSAGPFIIDHDQNLSVQAIGTYRNRRGWWTSWSLRHDSGLVSNPSDPDEVAADPDYAPLLPFVNLASDPPRVRPRTITDFSVGYEHRVADRRAWEIVGQVSNLFNRTALYNFQSIFVGTRLVQPRTAGIKFRIYF